MGSRVSIWPIDLEVSTIRLILKDWGYEANNDDDNDEDLRPHDPDHDDDQDMDDDEAYDRVDQAELNDLADIRHTG